jgi:HlyD family secretion protein
MAVSSPPTGSSSPPAQAPAPAAVSAEGAAGAVNGARPPLRARPRNRQRAKRWVKRAVGAVAGLVLVGLVVLAALPKPVPAEIVTAMRGELEVTVDEDGRARVKDRYVVSAPLVGNLARIELHPGDSVAQGAVLARIVPLSAPLLDQRSRKAAEARVAAAAAQRKQVAAQIARAKTAAAFADDESKRIRGLVERGALPQRDLDRAELESRTLAAELASADFGARVADYEVEIAQSALGRMTGKASAEDQLDLPSPVTGRILRVLQQSEGAVQVGTPLVEVGDPAALELVVDVLTSDAIRIQAGAKVHIERWGGEPLEGIVRLLEPSAFTRLSSLGVEEQRVNVVIDLRSPRDSWLGLGDGYRIEARIVVWKENDVLKVPASAVFRHDGGWAVFAARDGVARLTRVEVGQRSGVDVQITSGLADGARVIAHPSDRVVDGVKVVDH